MGAAPAIHFGTKDTRGCFAIAKNPQSRQRLHFLAPLFFIKTCPCQLFSGMPDPLSGVRYLYDTISQVIQPKPNLDHVDEIVFTSPSTVKAFIEIFGVLPRGKKCLAIGPITEQALRVYLDSSGL